MYEYISDNIYEPGEESGGEMTMTWLTVKEQQPERTRTENKILTGCRYTDTRSTKHH